MPIVRDQTEIRNPVDILLRASRPQRSSTHLPHRRDWRYAAEIFRHDDEDDTSYRGRESTVWDKLDWDAQIGVFGKEKRRHAVKRATELQEVMLDDEEGVEERRLPLGLDGTVDLDVVKTVATPERSTNSEDVGGVLTTPKMVSTTPKRILKSFAQARRSRQRFRSRADTIAGFRRSEEQADEAIDESEETWLPTRLVVCLKFSCQGTDKIQRILAGELVSGEAQLATPNSPAADVSGEVPAAQGNDLATLQVLDLKPSYAATTATTASTATPSHGSDTDTDRSVRSLVPFERQWLDETRNINMNDISGILRAPGLEVSALPESFNWFAEAVPVDSLFPPGVPISEKEIMAFYPHHVRWKGVALRLVNNAYFGDIVLAMQTFFRDKDKHPLTITNINQFFRDLFKKEMPHFKVSNFQGKPDRNLYTDQLKPLKLLNGSRYGFVVPTFDELLEGLVYLPAGLDARGLTQCLAWYLGVRDTFTPRLDLNVLHTQSLIRALRVPLKPYGPRNLDKLALQEWKENGQFAKRRVDEEGRSHVNRFHHSPKHLKRSRVTIGAETETLGVDVVVKLRHVLTFPYLAIGGMMCKALELGIEKAETRKAAREAQEGIEKPYLEEMEGPTKESSQEKSATALSGQEEAGPQDDNNDLQEIPLPGMPAGYRIPKRKRPLLEDEAAEIQSTNRISPGPRVPSAPLRSRAISISERRRAIAPHPLTTSMAAGEPLVIPPSYSVPGPTTAPASMFGHRRSQNPNHYHSAPYSSTFSDHHHPPPYANTFSDYAPRSHYDSGATSGWNAAYNSQHRSSDRAISAFAPPRSHHGSPTTSAWDPVYSSRHWFGNRDTSAPRTARYPSAQPESTSRNLNGPGYDGRRDH
ncbi:hypothetical protein P171DRAFT_153680 [Karstenula rhodostoma CBS 690.94]|uniref:Uncharacterized protein n=1 Tax=Karstenula rhodostoma CBS 690.94 TaxID=1392251 RepID=A0A9P4UIZ4_9PLEO|nr:hypothetical protein P171DRAFT_153680 [Karstenula rhodostoma CBS 690.94]